MEPKINLLEGRKTLIVNAVVALSALYPPIGDFVSNNPEIVLNGLALVNIALRFITKGKVRLLNK
jgi:hypothetical protein